MMYSCISSGPREFLEIYLPSIVVNTNRRVPVAVFIRCLTLLTMLLHSVYGCGWHHIHGCMSHCVENSDARHSPHCGHSHAPGHSHHHSSDPDSPSSHDQHSSECDHTECHFVATNAVALIAPPEHSFWIVIPQTVAGLSSSVKADVCFRPLLCSDTHAPAFCARIQVWRT